MEEGKVVAQFTVRIIEGQPTQWGVVFPEGMAPDERPPNKTIVEAVTAAWIGLVMQVAVNVAASQSAAAAASMVSEMMAQAMAAPDLYGPGGQPMIFKGDEN